MTCVASKAGVALSTEGYPGTDPAFSRHLPDGPALRAVSSLIGGRDGARAAGLALSHLPEDDWFAILVLDTAGATLLSLGAFPGEDVVAVWRSLGASSGLPLLMEREDGSREAAYDQVGRVQLGAVRIRRGHGLLSGRRPRFLVRRKTGRLPVAPQVFREDEIFAGR